MDFLHHLINTLLHLSPASVNDLANYVGPGPMYAVLFAIIFCETGLVILPFLPGDSLLFAVGAVCAISNAISFPIVAVLLIVAANAGDLVNYTLGYRIGPKVFHGESKLLNKKHLAEAHAFYEKYGRMTIILARFVPIVRTFAPFVAGIGKMHYPQFLKYNVVGAIAWVVGFTYAGYFFGNLPFVRKNLELLIFGIIFVSFLPGIIEIVRHKRASHKA